MELKLNIITKKILKEELEMQIETRLENTQGEEYELEIIAGLFQVYKQFNK